MIFRQICITTAGLLALSVKGLSQTPIPELPPNPDVNAGSSRPAFLQSSRPNSPQRATPRGDSSTGRIMTAIVELPVPEPVAVPPSQESTPLVPSPTPILTPIPTPAATPILKNPTIIFGDDQEEQPTPQPKPEPAPPAATTSEAPPKPETSPGVYFGGEQPLRPQASPARSAPSPSTEKPAIQEVDPETLVKQRRYSEVEPIAMANQSSALARSIGWARYNDHSYSQAEKWFKQAVQWDDADYEAAYGLALTLLREGETDKAEAVARWRLDQYPSMRKVLGDILTARAVQAYKQKDYRRSLQLFEEIETYRSLTRDEKILQAWNYFQIGNYTRAAQEFETLYAEKPDKFAAAGVFASYARLKDWAKIGDISKTYGGPLSDLYRDYVAQRYYDHRLYANAYATAPDKYPELKSYTSPAISLSGFTRYKSGDPGTSKLDELRGDASLVLYQADINRFSLDVGYSSLNSQPLPNSAFVGNVPLVGPRTYLFSPINSYNNLVDARVRYERSGYYTPFLELGISPVGGAVGPTAVGRAGVNALEDWGSWSVGVYRNSVKQSILSYTGFRDPYNGVSWGRVSEDGASLTAYDSLQNGWGIYGQLGGSILEGPNVETNQHVSVALALNRQIELPGFTFMTIGPTLSFEHYAKNLSFFTFGQGGYFSPDYIVQGALSTRFLTKEGRPYLLKGDFSFGLQSYKEAVTPIFPLVNSAASFQGTQAETFITTARIDGLFLLGSHFAFGGSLSYNKTANYSEFVGAGLLKYFFEPRSGLYETDF